MLVLVVVGGLTLRLSGLWALNIAVPVHAHVRGGDFAWQLALLLQARRPLMDALSSASRDGGGAFSLGLCCGSVSGRLGGDVALIVLGGAQWHLADLANTPGSAIPVFREGAQVG